MKRDDLARAIFDYLNRTPVAGDDEEPYVFNGDPDHLVIHADGKIDCMKMADGIIAHLPKP